MNLLSVATKGMDSPNGVFRVELTGWELETIARCLNCVQIAGPMMPSVLEPHFVKLVDDVHAVSDTFSLREKVQARIESHYDAN